MIAVDTSVIIAIAANEAEAEVFRPLIGRQPVIIGWPTLLEARMVLTGKGFASAAKMIERLAVTPNVTTIAFDEKHYRAAEDAFERYGRVVIWLRSIWATASPTPLRQSPGRLCCSRVMISGRQI